LKYAPANPARLVFFASARLRAFAVMFNAGAPPVTEMMTTLAPALQVQVYR
jgi:hypothetical protein